MAALVGPHPVRGHMGLQPGQLHPNGRKRDANLQQGYLAGAPRLWKCGGRAGVAGSGPPSAAWGSSSNLVQRESGCDWTVSSDTIRPTSLGRIVITLPGGEASGEGSSNGARHLSELDLAPSAGRLPVEREIEVESPSIFWRLR